MTQKKNHIWLKVLIAFVTGGVLVFCIGVWFAASFATKQRKVYTTVNHALAMKFNNDISYKQFCSDSGFRKIEDNWPSGAKTFHV